MFFRHKKHKTYRRELVEKLLRELPRGTLLDAPCGDGTLGSLARGLGYDVSACDIESLPSSHTLRFQVADLNHPLPYPSEAFDVVLSIEGIEHLEHPAVCIQEFSRVLKPGGVLLLSTPNVNNVQSRLHFFLGGHFSGFKTLTQRALEPRKDYPHWHVTLPYLPTLLYLMTRNGFELEAIDVTMIKPKQWLFVPLVFWLWLGARRKSAVAKELCSWKLLLGRSVLIRATKHSHSES